MISESSHLNTSSVRGLLRPLLALSIPTIIEQILSTLLQYVDTAMVGQLGEQATAAVSTTTTVTWLVNSIPGAIGTALLILIANAWGAGDRERVRRLSQQALFLSLVSGLLLGAVSVALSPYIPVWMGAESAIQTHASNYFLIVSLPMVFRTTSSVLGAALRAVQDTKTPMIISALGNGINIVLNTFFIYILSMGVEGAAIASAISYAASGLLMFRAYRRKSQLKWRWRDFQIDKKLLGECSLLGAPVLGTSLVSCFGYVTFASLVSGMGTTIFAAHSIAVTAETIFYVPGYGLRTATSTMIGAARGEENWTKVSAIGKLSVFLTVAIMFLSGVVLFFGAHLLMSIFSPVDAVVDLGAQMLRMVALSEPFYGLMIVLEGIFYGLGRTRYAFLVEAAGMWCVRILFTYLCVKVWGFGLSSVWMCMIADNVSKAILFALPFIIRPWRRHMIKGL